MKRTMYFMLAALLTAGMMTSCKKGDTGPAGEQGEQGPAGPTGEKGDKGTANVIYSNWINITIGSTFSTTIDAVGITADVINKGEVKVYINLNTAADPTIVAMPYTEAQATEAEPDLPVWEILPAFKVGKIGIFSNYQLNNLPVRYVIIPGGVLAGRNASIDWNNYAEVKKYLNLKD